MFKIELFPVNCDCQFAFNWVHIHSNTHSSPSVPGAQHCIELESAGAKECLDITLYKTHLTDSFQKPKIAGT